MKSGKRQITEGIELPNQEKIRMLGEKENYKYLGILEVDTTKQAEIKKNSKRISQTNVKAFRNRAQQLESHQKDKNLDCPTSKILGSILEIDEERTNEPEDKKANDDAQGLTSERWHWLYVSRKEGGRVLASIDDCENASIRKCEDYIKKNKERLITAASRDKLTKSHTKRPRHG